MTEQEWQHEIAARDNRINVLDEMVNRYRNEACTARLDYEKQLRVTNAFMDLIHCFRVALDNE